MAVPTNDTEVIQIDKVATTRGVANYWQVALDTGLGVTYFQCIDWTVPLCTGAGDCGGFTCTAGQCECSSG